jgi:hypothetical protein
MEVDTADKGTEWINSEQSEPGRGMGVLENNSK